MKRYRDRGRDLAIYLGRKRCGMKWTTIGAVLGGMDDSTVSTAGKRFEKRLLKDKKLTQLAEAAERKLKDPQG